VGVLRIINIIHEMLEFNLYTPAQIAQVQEQRFRKLLRYAGERSPFYRRLYKGFDLRNCKLTDLPAISKPEMMANYDSFVTDNRLRRNELREWLADKSNLGKLYKGKFIPFQTSGTTGENALVVYNRKGLDYAHAAVVARHAMEEEPDLRYQLRLLFKALFHYRHRMAMIVMDGGPYPAYTVCLYAPPTHKLFTKNQIYSLMDPTEALVEKLNQFQPHSMFSYPSILNILAREQLEGRLNIALDEEISSLISGSEPLSETTKLLAKRAWNRDIQDTYGTSECIVMARACKNFHRMHVMSDLCILEIVDKSNRPVPDGQHGEKVLMTNLTNYLQPFIRYEISDITGYSTEPCCRLPFPTLLPVEGRTDDIFYIDRPSGGYQAVHPYLFLGPIVELDEVKEYQLVQSGRNEVTFNYVPITGATGLDEKVRKVLEAGMGKSNLLDRISLKTIRLDDIPRDKKSGKFRQIISLVGAPQDLDERERLSH